MSTFYKKTCRYIDAMLKILIKVAINDCNVDVIQYSMLEKINFGKKYVGHLKLFLFVYFTININS
jgi:phage-related holin